MSPLRRTLFLFLFFVGTLIVGFYLSSIDRSLVLPFSMICNGILCALIAQGKNRSAIGWFFVGLVGGVIALGVIMMAHEVAVNCDAQEAA